MNHIILQPTQPTAFIMQQSSSNDIIEDLEECDIVGSKQGLIVLPILLCINA
jgi:hypothetical protein